MVELSRRFFLGGAISLLASNTFAVTRLGNTPQIWADRVHDDTAGLGALLRKEPVIFAREMIGVDAHQGITFHFGRFKISQTIDIPPGAQIKCEGIQFDLTDLYEEFPALRGRHKELRHFTGIYVRYAQPKDSRRLYHEAVWLPDTEEEIRAGREKLARQEEEAATRWAERMKNQSTYADWDRKVSA